MTLFTIKVINKQLYLHSDQLRLPVVSWFVELETLTTSCPWIGKLYCIFNPFDLPKLVSWVSQCSTERSAEMVCMGVYIHPTVSGARGGRHAWTHVSTLLWTPLFSCVSHRGVNTQTHSDSCKHKERARLYCITYASVVNLYVWRGAGGLSPPVWRSIIKLIYVKLQFSGKNTLCWCFDVFLK